MVRGASLPDACASGVPRRGPILREGPERSGFEFIDEIEDVLAELATSPWSGSPFGEGARRRLLRRFPFEVVYSIGEEEILVLAVAHQSRRFF